MTTMIALVGEQPIPNLIPVRYLKPEALVLVYTKRTEDKAMNLVRLLAENGVVPVKVDDPYDLTATRSDVLKAIQGHTDLLFNLTGGTKTMALAAYELAKHTNSPFIYLQTEGAPGQALQTVLYRYRFEAGQSVLEQPVPIDEQVISLDDYLRAHFGDYETGDFHRTKQGGLSEGGLLEKAVHDALKDWVDDIKVGVRPKGVKQQMEIDLVIRRGNQVGFIEVKSGGGQSGKEAIDQLTTAAARELSGIYTARFLVTAATAHDEYKALASRLDITVIELPGYRDGRLGRSDREVLRRQINARLPVGGVTHPEIAC